MVEQSSEAQFTDESIQQQKLPSKGLFLLSKPEAI